MEAIWKSEYSLKEIVDRKNFKTYEELKKRLDEVNGLGDVAPAKSSHTEEMLERNLAKARADEVPWDEPKAKAPTFESPKFGGNTSDDDEDEDLAMFRKLAED
jgi:hypothetical protein